MEVKKSDRFKAFVLTFNNVTFLRLKSTDSLTLLYTTPDSFPELNGNYKYKRSKNAQ